MLNPHFGGDGQKYPYSNYNSGYKGVKKWILKLNTYFDTDKKIASDGLYRINESSLAIFYQWCNDYLKLEFIFLHAYSGF